MDSKRLRPVLFSVFIPEQIVDRKKIDGTGCWSGYVKRGVFHCWGTSLQIDSMEGLYKINYCAVTVAIIEDIHGNVFEVKPDRIKFIQ